MVKSYVNFIFVLYLIAGLYLLNSSFKFIKMPEFILSIESWIFLVAAVLIIFAGFGFLKNNRHRV